MAVHDRWDTACMFVLLHSNHGLRAVWRVASFSHRRRRRDRRRHRRRRCALRVVNLAGLETEFAIFRALTKRAASTATTARIFAIPPTAARRYKTWRTSSHLQRATRPMARTRRHLRRRKSGALRVVRPAGLETEFAIASAITWRAISTTATARRHLQQATQPMARTRRHQARSLGRRPS